ncbi:hypothetical protein H1C71_039202, partial [Ictidomys tridecemlineatus]
ETAEAGRALSAARRARELSVQHRTASPEYSRAQLTSRVRLSSVVVPLPAGHTLRDPSRHTVPHAGLTVPPSFQLAPSVSQTCCMCALQDQHQHFCSLHIF